MFSETLFPCKIAFPETSEIILKYKIFGTKNNYSSVGSGVQSVLELCHYLAGPINRHRPICRRDSWRSPAGRDPKTIRKLMPETDRFKSTLSQTFVFFLQNKTRVREFFLIFFSLHGVLLLIYYTPGIGLFFSHIYLLIWIAYIYIFTFFFFQFYNKKFVPKSYTGVCPVLPKNSFIHAQKTPPIRFTINRLVRLLRDSLYRLTGSNCPRSTP